jgi:hypothetical protein
MNQLDWMMNGLQVKNHEGKTFRLISMEEDVLRRNASDVPPAGLEPNMVDPVTFMILRRAESLRQQMMYEREMKGQFDAMAAFARGMVAEIGPLVAFAMDFIPTEEAKREFDARAALFFGEKVLPLAEKMNGLVIPRREDPPEVFAAVTEAGVALNELRESLKGVREALEKQGEVEPGEPA